MIDECDGIAIDTMMIQPDGRRRYNITSSSSS
jgi:hypothetical protein